MTSPPVVLRPIPATVAAYIVVGVFLVALALLLVFGMFGLDFSAVTGGAAVTLPYTIPIGVVVAGAGLFLAIRGARMKAILTETDATIVNLLRTRVIPRALVTGMKYTANVWFRPYPAIVWKDPTGESRVLRVTTVNFLSPAQFDSPLQTQANAVTDQLRAWCEAGRGQDGR